MTAVLGINAVGYISSAALIVDGEVRAAACEERFTRQKRTRKFPVQSIEFCLKSAQVKFEELQGIGIAWNPMINVSSLKSSLSAEILRHRGEYLYAVPSHVLQLMNLRSEGEIGTGTQILRAQGLETAVHFINHHDSHAASAYFSSPFEEAAILTCDGFGEKQTVKFYSARGTQIESLAHQDFPHSVGAFYSTFTDWMGYTVDSDEWKVMAIASYGRESGNPYLSAVRSLVRLKPEGRFELDLNYFDFFNWDYGRYFSPRFVELFGPPKKKEDEITEKEQQICFAMQKVSEEIIAHQATWLAEKTGSRSLCVAGGYFMNSVLNGKLTTLTPFSEIYIPSAADDSGTAVGAAYCVYHQMTKGEQRHPVTHNYWGPAFSDSEIESTLKKFKIPHARIESIEKHTADLLTQGRVVGWFQGRMEFGQRALGARSILADPRELSMKDRINAAIKYREAYRPFAPAILEERVADYFLIPERGGSHVPFMERVFLIRPEKRASIPAVTHVDGTGRLQTVRRVDNPRYYDTIAEFEKQTGIPIVLNTSFNVQGEPIVLSPTDAIRTFFSSGLDDLILGSYWVTKAR